MSSRYERMLEAIAKGEKITEEPICRREIFLKALANKEGASNLPTPICREEEFYKAIIKGEKITKEPICKKEEYLKALANGEEMPECSVLNCKEEALFRKVCSSSIGGGGNTPSTPTTYSVTFGNGVTVLNGSTKLTSGTKVESGTKLTISYTLSEGHHLGSFKVNGVDAQNNSTITITSNTSITFSELKNSYKLTFDEGVTVLYEGDSIGNNSVLLYGSKIIVSYTLSEGYTLTSFQVNGKDVENGSTITVTEPINITFTQEANSFEVTFGNGVTVKNGNVSVNSGDRVAYGTALTIGYVLTEHYHLTSFQINGVTAENNSTITVTDNINIVFTQAIDTYTVTFDEGVTVKNGEASLTSGDAVPYGTNLVVGYTLTDGYALTSFQVNGVDTENNSTIVVTEDTIITFAQEEESSSGGSTLTFSRTFSENSPAQISAVSAEISANNMTSEQVAETYGWNIGDKISYSLTTGENVEMRIIGFNHDDKSDGTGKAGITLEMIHCLATKYKMNNSATNAGGYPATLMRNTTLPSIKATIPQEWQDVIKLVDKKSTNGGASTYSETVITNEALFLLSEIEMFGSITWGHSNANEGDVYEYWKGRGSSDRKKQIAGTTVWCTLRSCSKSDDAYFCAINSLGGCGRNAAEEAYAISFAFCV